MSDIIRWDWPYVPYGTSASWTVPVATGGSVVIPPPGVTFAIGGLPPLYKPCWWCRLVALRSGPRAWALVVALLRHLGGHHPCP